MLIREGKDIEEGERGWGDTLSYILLQSLCVGGQQFCGRQEEACDLPVHYSAFPQLWPSAVRTQDLQSVSEGAILLPKTSCLRDRCLAFTKGGGGSITSGKLFMVGLFAGPLFKKQEKKVPLKQLKYKTSSFKKNFFF